MSENKKKIYNWFVYVIPESSWLENYSYSQTNGLYRLYKYCKTETKIHAKFIMEKKC